MSAETKVKMAVLVLLETVGEEGRVPSGVVYATLQMHDAEFWTLAQYQAMLAAFASIFSVDHREVSLTPAGRQAHERLVAAKQQATR